MATSAETMEGSIQKKKDFKSVAEDLNIKESTLRNEINKSKSGERADRLQRTFEFIDACDNTNALEWLCNQMGGVFVENKITSAGEYYGKTVNDIQTLSIPQALKQFSSLVQTIISSCEDGKISKDESDQIRQDWDLLQRHVESFVLACENHYFEK